MSDSVEISQTLQVAIAEAFALAARWLEQEEAFSYLFWLEDGEKKLAMLEPAGGHDGVLAQIRAWGREADPAAQHVVQMGRATLDAGDREIDALIAHCAERGEAQAIMLMQELERDDAGTLRPASEVGLLRQIPNDFFGAAGDEAPGAVDEALDDEVVDLPTGGPLADPTRIDLVARDSDGRLLLVITDAGLIDDPEERYAALTAKLRAYVTYAVAGQLAEEFPDVPLSDVVIRVVCAVPPTPEMEEITSVQPRDEPDKAIPVEFHVQPMS
ncbi:MAG: DUF6572 domain-containing protein [Acidobacteriota bacterium]